MRKYPYAANVQKKRKGTLCHICGKQVAKVKPTGSGRTKKGAIYPIFPKGVCSYREVTVQVNWFRGDDEVIRVCSACADSTKEAKAEAIDYIKRST